MAIILATVFHIVPVLPFANSFGMFIWFFRISAGLNLYKIVLRFGSPAAYMTSLSNINWQGIQMYAQNAMTSSEFFYIMTSTSCLSLKQPLTLAMMPMLIVAIRSVAAYASRTFHNSSIYQRLASPAVSVVLSKGAVLDQATTFAEIALLFYLVALIITPSRNILMTYFYFNMLKTRYVSPDSTASHAAVWSKINEISLPYRLKAPPIVERGIQMIQGYFLSTNR